MIAIFDGDDRRTFILENYNLELCLINNSRLYVVTTREDNEKDLIEFLEKNTIKYKVLSANRAFHSKFLSNIESELSEMYDGIDLVYNDVFISSREDVQKYSKEAFFQNTFEVFDFSRNIKHIRKIKDDHSVVVIELLSDSITKIVKNDIQDLKTIVFRDSNDFVHLWNNYVEADYSRLVNGHIVELPPEVLNEEYCYPDREVEKNMNTKFFSKILFNYDGGTVSHIIDLSKNSHLFDHKVKGRPILPGAYYLNVYFHLSQALSKLDRKNYSIKDVYFLKTLDLTGKSSIDLSLVLERSNDSYLVGITYGGEKFSMAVVYPDKPFAGNVNLESLLYEFKESKLFNKESIYENMDKRELNYSKSFKSMESQLVKNIYKIGKVSGDVMEDGISSNLMDSSFHFISERDDKTMIPYHIKNLYFNTDSLPGTFYSIRNTVEEDDDKTLSDQYIVDETGRILVKLQGFTRKALKERLNSQWIIEKDEVELEFFDTFMPFNVVSNLTEGEMVELSNMDRLTHLIEPEELFKEKEYDLSNLSFVLSSKNLASIDKNEYVKKILDIVIYQIKSLKNFIVLQDDDDNDLNILVGLLRSAWSEYKDAKFNIILADRFDHKLILLAPKSGMYDYRDGTLSIYKVKTFEEGKKYNYYAPSKLYPLPYTNLEIFTSGQKPLDNGDVLTKVLYHALNFKESLYLYNKLEKFEQDNNFALEGTVEIVESRSKDWKVGDKAIFYTSKEKANFITFHENELIKIPDESEIDFSCLPISGTTAYYSLNLQIP